MLLLRPVDTHYPVTQGFGENPALYPGTAGHNGLDYGLPEGQRIYAAADGTVLLSGLDSETAANPRAGYGLHVRLGHADGSLTLYGHLSALQVEPGQTVEMGAVIGLSGNTGRSTGPHLHFELRTAGSMTSAIDPARLIVDRLPDALGLFTVTITPEGAGLRVRTQPVATGKKGVIRSLKAGEQVRVFGLTGSDCWLRTDEGVIKFDPAWVTIETAPAPAQPPEPPEEPTVTI